MRLDLDQLFSKAAKVLFLISVCFMMVISCITPVWAIGTTPSAPHQGEAQLHDIQRKSEEVLERMPDLEESQRKTSGTGLNSVQGSADLDKLHTPANSQDATTVKQEFENLIDRVTGRD